MKYLVVEPIVNSGRLCSFTTYSENHEFLIQHIATVPAAIRTHTEIQHYYFGDYTRICFDAFKTMDVFNFKFKFLYDVKVLYELAGWRFRNLIGLGTQVLGEGRMRKYTDLSDRVNAHIRSYSVAKIDYKVFSSEELFPEGLIEDLYRERSMIIMELFKRFDVEEVRDFYEKRFFDVIKHLHFTSLKPINLSTSSLENSTHFAKTLKAQGDEVRLKFNAVGAKTGRLSFKKGSLNLYNLPRPMRKYIVAPDGYDIVQFDYKSFQPRLAIFSTQEEDFKNKFENIDDIYSVFPGDREKNKISFLAWMFSLRKDELFEEHASPIQDLRTKLFYEAKKSGRLLNRFGRYMKYSGEEKNVVFQNYITSMEVDSMLSNFIKVNHLLVNKKSRIICPFHDALLLYIHDDEKSLVLDVKEMMEQIGGFSNKFPVSVLSGNNWGEMS